MRDIKINFWYWKKSSMGILKTNFTYLSLKLTFFISL